VNVYYDVVFHGYFAGDFLNFYFGPYFTKFFPFDLNFSPTYFAGSNQGVYLWYLFWLFVFSLITFHLFKWLAKEGNRNKLSRLYAACNRRGGILLLAIPLIIVNIAAVPPFFVFPSGYGGWKLPAYLVLFITAYVMASSPQFEESIEKNKTTALLLGIITSLSIVALLAVGLSDPSAMERYYVLVSTVWALNGWCWVTAILGFGRKHLSFDHKYLKISNELVLPFYILHQSVIVAVSFYVVGSNLIVVEKYLLVVLASFPIIVALLYPISKINLLRFLFGMRMRNRPS
jgi:glucan biosynthesis protein C